MKATNSRFFFKEISLPQVAMLIEVPGSRGCRTIRPLLGGCSKAYGNSTPTVPRSQSVPKHFHRPAPKHK